MRIGIDMRMAGSGEGIGRYIEELVLALSKIDHSNQYFLLVNKNSNFQTISKQIANPNFQFVEVKTKYYSWAEQTYFVYELLRLRLDLVHFASFNAPIFYPGKFVVTIHDIIHHVFPGKKKSRALHRLAYRLTFWVAVARAQKVIAVSESSKTDIIRSFRPSPKKIIVIHEGVKLIFSAEVSESRIADVLNKYGIRKPYFLFVGVWRQYKNIVRLARAFDILKRSFPGPMLVLAGKIDPFYPEIKDEVFRSQYSKDIQALGFVPDEDLQCLYKAASGFVIPSLMEGFGLIAVEAQASGVPVAASRIPTLREILGESAIFFDPLSVQAIADAMADLLSQDGALEAKGEANAKRFTWDRAAHETLRIYQQTL